MSLTFNRTSIKQEGVKTSLSSGNSKVSMLDIPAEMGTYLLRRTQYFSRQVQKTDFVVDTIDPAHDKSKKIMPDCI